MKERFIAFILFFYGLYYYVAVSFFEEASVLDELLVLLLIFPVLYRIKAIVRNKNLFALIKILGSIVLIGLLSSIKYQYQPFIIALKGGIEYFKSFVPLIFLISYYKNQTVNIKKLNNAIYRHFIFGIWLIALGIGYQFVFKRTEMEYVGPLPRIVSFFSPSSVYGIVISFMSAVYFYLYGLGLIKRNRVWLISVLVFLSLRVKAIIFSLILTLSMYIKRKIFSIKTIVYLVITLIALLSILPIKNLIQQKFVYTFASNSNGSSTARSMLYLQSFNVAVDHFPLGSGFGTYGTHFSSVVYSPLYQIYKLSNVFGLSKKQHSFINDTQWPPILAECGFVGVLLFLLLFYSLYKLIIIQKSISFLKNQIILLFILLFIDSSSTAIFFNSGSSAIYVLMGIVYLNRLQNIRNS